MQKDVSKSCLFSGCFLWSLVQCERRALRIHQLRDAAAARHLHWAAHDLRAILGGTGECRVEIRCFGVIKPHRRCSLAFGYGHDAAHLLITDSENSISSYWPHIHVMDDFPSEQFRIQIEGCRLIARQKFVPTELPGLR